MTFRQLAFAAAMLGIASIAVAHIHLRGSIPADNSVVASSPRQVTLQFSEPARLTALSVHKEGEQEATALSPLPKEPSDAVTVPIEVAGPGKYEIKWRAIGSDNHVMGGTLHFTVTGT